MKETIPGVILIISCNKHKETRLKDFILSKKEYIGWKVYIVLGDPNLQTNYLINSNIMTIKCGDSYIHIMKKLVIAIKYIFELYNIEEGILRCGDDLIFNERKLEKFLSMENKKDYMGYLANENCNQNITKRFDNFMPNYFYTHQEDIINPINDINVPLEYLLRLNEIPNITYTAGVVVYLSNKSCHVLIKEFEYVNFDIFFYDPSYGFPYIIEDIGVGFALKKNNIIPFKYNLCTSIPYDPSIFENDINEECIAYHTNKYK